LRGGEVKAARAQEANGKSKPDKHGGKLTAPTKKASSSAPSERRNQRFILAFQARLVSTL